MFVGWTCDSPEAIRNCAPYGMRPCTTHENVSKMLAALHGFIPKRVLMLLAIFPTDNMAIVLFAVHKLVIPTIAPIISSPPRLLCI